MTVEKKGARSSWSSHCHLAVTLSTPTTSTSSLPLERCSLFCCDTVLEMLVLEMLELVQLAQSINDASRKTDLISTGLREYISCPFIFDTSLSPRSPRKDSHNANRAAMCSVYASSLTYRNSSRCHGVKPSKKLIAVQRPNLNQSIKLNSFSWYGIHRASL